MVEKLEGTGRVYAEPRSEDESGVRENPWLAHLRALEARPERDARSLLDAQVRKVGPRVLSRFERVHRSEHPAILAGAVERLAAEVPAPAPEGAEPNQAAGDPALPTDARVAHAVLCEAMPADLRRWVDELKADPAEVARALTLARRRVAALGARELRVFLAVCALDDVAAEDEVGQVVLRAAVAFQMRWNTAHQNVSRAWRKICEGTGLGAYCDDWRAGRRFVLGPPPLELFEAAAAYMDACSGRDGRDGEAFETWLKAHEAHNAWFNEWKKQSSRATRRWKELAQALDASAVRPTSLHVPLVQGCAALGIDRWVIPAKLAQQSWRELLEPANRPAAPARAAWLVFLRENELGPEVEAAFRELERDAALADVASVELEHAYRRLLVAAEGQSGQSRDARDAFRALIESGEHQRARIDGASRGATPGEVPGGSRHDRRAPGEPR